MDERYLSEKRPDRHEIGEGARLLHELEQSGNFVFHGSKTGNVAELEARQPYDYTDGTKQEHGSPCVAATRSADVAIFRALVTHDYTGFGPDDQGRIRFRASQKALDAARGKKGFVYVLSQEGFSRFGVHPTMEWRSQKNEVPLQVITVTEKDLSMDIEIIPPAQEF